MSFKEHMVCSLLTNTIIDRDVLPSVCLDVSIRKTLSTDFSESKCNSQQREWVNLSLKTYNGNVYSVVFIIFIYFTESRKYSIYCTM